MEYELTRREFLEKAGGITTALIAYLLGVNHLEASQDKEIEKKQEKRRLARLEYFLNPPKKELYEVRGEKIELKLNEGSFSFSRPVYPVPQDMHKSFFNVLYNKEGVVEVDDVYKKLKVLDKDRKDTYFQVAKRNFKNKEVESKLKEIVKKEGLPNDIYPTWHYGDNIIILLGTITLKPLTDDHKKRIREYGKKKGLKLIKDNSTMRFSLSHATLLEFKNSYESEFKSPFEASEAFMKSGLVKWCEPDFARELNFFEE